MNLRDYLSVLWRRRWLIGLMLIIGGGAVYAVGRQPVETEIRYQGSAILALEGVRPPNEVSYYEYVARETTEILELVAEDLGEGVYEDSTTIEHLQANALTFATPDIGVIQINVSDQPSEEIAEEVLGLYGSHFISFAASAELAAQQKALDAVETRIVALEEEVTTINDELNDQSADITPEDRAAGWEPDRLLTAQLNSAISNLSVAEAEAERLNGQSVTDLSPLRQVGRPTVDQEADPVDPLGFRGRLVVGVLLGGLLGVGLAIALHRFDRRVYRRQDIEPAFQLPVLAEVPKVAWRKRRNYQLVAATDPRAPASEAYRLLRSSIANARAQQLQAGGEGQTSASTVVLVTSPSSATGKSTTVANLAVASADAGQRTLVVGADLRQATVHYFFGVESQPGIVDAVEQLRQAQDPLVLGSYLQSTKNQAISVIANGAETDSPGETVAAAGPLLELARKQFDVIYIDSPPLPAGSDVTELLGMADLVLLVGRVGKTTTDEGAAVYEITERFNAPMCGLALIGSRRDTMAYGRKKFGRSILERLRRPKRNAKAENDEEPAVQASAQAAVGSAETAPVIPVPVPPSGDETSATTPDVSKTETAVSPDPIPEAEPAATPDSAPKAEPAAISDSAPKAEPAAISDSVPKAEPPAASDGAPEAATVVANGADQGDASPAETPPKATAPDDVAPAAATVQVPIASPPPDPAPDDDGVTVRPRDETVVLSIPDIPDISDVLGQASGPSLATGTGEPTGERVDGQDRPKNGNGSAANGTANGGDLAATTDLILELVDEDEVNQN